MNKKVTKLSDEQLNAFSKTFLSFGSLATLSLPGTFLQELKDCGINERGTARNELVGCIITNPSGSQLAIETVFHDIRDSQDDGDLHIVNFGKRNITSYYRGWGTWEQHYGRQHHAYKAHLRIGTVNE